MAHSFEHDRIPFRPAHGKRRLRHHQPSTDRNLEKRTESVAKRVESVAKRMASAEKRSVMLQGGTTL